MARGFPGAEAPLASEWDALADRLSAPPDLRPGWFDAWWRAFGGGRLHVLTARAGGRLAGLVPVLRKGGGTRSPTNWESSVYGFLAQDDRAASELAHSLFEDRPLSVILRFLRRQDVGPIREAARTAGYRMTVRTIQRSPYLPLQGGQPALRGTKALRELRRRRRRLEEIGRLSFEVHDGTQRLDALLEEGLAVEDSGWKGAGRTSIRSRPETERFYREVAGWAADAGFLRLAFLRLDARPVAFDYCLEGADVHELVKTGFEPTFGRYAPGMLLRQHMIQRAADLGLRSYEFLGADEPWKLEWTTLRRDRLMLAAFAPGVRGRLLALGWSWGPPLARGLRAAIRGDRR